MSSVNNWEVYCLNGDGYQMLWSPVQPTTCPLNHTHTISSDPGPKIITVVEQTNVKILEEFDGVTQGYYRFRGFDNSVPAGPSGNTTVFTHTWAYPVTLLNGYFIATDSMMNDVISVTVADNTVAGYITANVSPGDKIINVNQTVLNHAANGFYCNITDGVHLNLLGEIAQINTVSGNIVISTAATNSFHAASPTYVRLTVGVIDQFRIPVSQWRYDFAQKKIGGKYIPANTPLNIHYMNFEGNAKVFSFNFEYLY